MRKRLSSEEFLKVAEQLWQVGPKVRYKNPDAWITYLVFWRNLGELQKSETTIVPPRCKIVKKPKECARIGA